MPDNKKALIFNAYSEQLYQLRKHSLISKIKTKAKKPYLCPICLREFDETHLNIENDEHLTLEDAPPRSLGGKANILSCKKCNNTCGHEIDAHLTNRMKELDQTKFFLGTESRVKARKADLQVNGTIKIDQAGVMTIFHAKENNNPDKLQEYIKSVKANDIIDIDFMPTKVNDKRLQIALLKTAYLVMFQQFGYIFIFDEAYERIRKQLLNPKEDIYPLEFWFMGGFAKELTQTVPFVKEKNLASMMPFFELKTKYSSHIFAAILPLNNIAIENPIAEMKLKFEAHDEFSLPMEKFDPKTDFIKNIDKARELLNFTKTLK